MAQGQGFTATAVNPAFENFKLDFNQLATPILKKDAEFKQQEKDLNSYNDALDSLNFLEADQSVADAKRDELHTQEQQIRDSVGGNILDPRYQNKLRKLLRKNTGDRFFQNAAHNLQEVERWKKFSAEYSAKHGEQPPGYLDPFGQEFQNDFVNSEVDGQMNFAGIATKLDFQSATDDRVKKLIQTQLSGQNKQRWKVKKIQDPNTGEWMSVIYDHKNKKVTQSQIMDLLENDSNLNTGAAHGQLEAQFLEEAQLQEEYGTFENFRRSHFKTSAATFSFEDDSETFRQVLRTPTASNPYSYSSGKNDGDELNSFPTLSINQLRVAVGQSSKLPHNTAPGISAATKKGREGLAASRDQFVKNFQSDFGMDVELVDNDGYYEMVITPPNTEDEAGNITEGKPYVVNLTDLNTVRNAPQNIREMITKNAFGPNGIAGKIMSMSMENITYDEWENFQDRSMKYNNLDTKEEQKWLAGKASDMADKVLIDIHDENVIFSDKHPEFNNIPVSELAKLVHPNDLEELMDAAHEAEFNPDGTRAQGGTFSSKARRQHVRDNIRRSIQKRVAGNPDAEKDFKSDILGLLTQYNPDSDELNYPPRKAYNKYVEDAFKYGVDANDNIRPVDESADGGNEAGVNLVNAARHTFPAKDSKRELTKIKKSIMANLDSNIRLRRGDSSSAILLVDPLTNKAFSEDQYEAILGSEMENIFYRFDTPDGIVLDAIYKNEKGETQDVEIRNVGLVTTALSDMGLGSIASLNRMNAALTSFNDTETFAETGVSVTVDKLANAGKIGDGFAQRPLRKLTNSEKDPTTGEVGKPNMFAMKRNDGTTSYFDDIFALDAAYVADMAELEFASLKDNELVSVSKEALGNTNFKIKSDDVNLNFAKPMFKAVVSMPTSGPSLRMTSATDGDHVAGGDHGGFGFDASWDAEGKEMMSFIKTPAGQRWMQETGIRFFMEIPGAKDQDGNLQYGKELGEAERLGFPTEINNNRNDAGGYQSTAPHLHFFIPKSHAFRRRVAEANKNKRR